MATLDPRFRPELERYQEVAAPHLHLVDAPDAESEAEAIAATIPDDAVRAVSVALLQRIVDSDQMTGQSLPGEVRAALARRPIEQDPDRLALELALCAVGVNLGPGIGLARLRLHLFDPVIASLERVPADAATPLLVEEVEAAVGLLASPDFDPTTEGPETANRREPLVAFLLRLRPDSLPPIAFDDGDGYGATMRTLVTTDAQLAGDLAPWYALLAGGTSILPTKRWSDAAAAQLAAHPSPTLTSTVVRSLRPLTDLAPPPTAGLPGMPRALRLPNQRLVRGLLWLGSRVDRAWAADAYPDIGIKLGTSGRHDNTALDGAAASTCAAVLGEIGTPEAHAGLARMQARITNQPVGKQIAAAIERFAAATGASDGDAALPTFELDRDGRRSIAVGDWSAEVVVAPDGTVATSWHGPDGQSSPRPPTSVRNDRPSEVAAAADLVKRIRAAIVDERGRAERDFAAGRERAFDAWRARWLDHPIGRVFGRRLVWRFDGHGNGGGALAGLPAGATIEDAAGRPIGPSSTSTVRLWHPVEATTDEVGAWRRRIVADRIEQPVKQVFRETYAPTDPSDDALIDRRFAGRALDQGRLRALMRERRWTGGVLGPWDQGEEGSIGRDVEGTEWRAEVGLEAAGRADHRDAVTVVRTRSLRFFRGRGRSARPAKLDAVPPRILSEVLRDVDLFTAVADITRRSPGQDVAGREEPSAIVASRAAILRAIIPGLPVATRLSVFGRWLRIEGPPDYAISLVDGRAFYLLDESDVNAPARPSSAETPAAYLPATDDPVLLGILELALRLARGTE
jgi:Domain of unknown function (DUF4132)